MIRSAFQSFEDAALNYKVDFGPVLQELNANSGVKHDWWTIDLCFWPDAWPGTAEAKKACDLLNRKYGSEPAAAKAPAAPPAPARRSPGGGRKPAKKPAAKAKSKARR